ncbi:ligand-binding sensor domain-containing protein [Sanyastnella coralliicola]|uniref:ligand-binding sensor domain-containing protein n=1 Tax=Sanyastnella coralliicola TaxID=3069118 RepID=UPI0027BAAEBB|nr:two-component regulator propeller domain-containing protein [Longitalea sp. SCSIO 12813]
MKKLLFLIFISLFAIGGNGQTLPFIEWSTNDGLAQSQVRCFHQDHLGYLWIGTLGGVSRFDGDGFRNFSRQDGLLGNQVNAIAEFRDSLMVFGSVGGISLFNGESFETHRFPEGMEDAQVNHIREDNGKLFISTEDGAITFEKGQWHRFIEEGHAKRTVTDMGVGVNFYTIYKDRIHWEGKGGISKIILTSDSIGATIMDAYPDGKGGLLIATVGQGVVHRTPNGLRFIGPNDGLISENISGITPGQEGEFWLKSRDGFSRLYVNENGEVVDVAAFSEFNGLPNSDIRGILCDKDGNVWLGSNGSGLLKFIGDQVMHFNSDDLIAGDIVMTILPDESNGYWVGTYDNGLSHIMEDSVINFGIGTGLKSSRVWSASKGRDGQYWFGTSGGLSLYENGDIQRTFTKEDGLPHKQILSLLEEEGVLWVGTARGLVRHSHASGKFEMIEGVPRKKIRGIVRMGNDLWMASNAGVFRWNDTEITVFDESTGLPDNSTYCIAQDERGTIWVGTESGLCTISADGEIKPIKLKGGFGANHVNFIRFDKDQHAWLGTNDGVFLGLFEGGEYQWSRLGKHDGISFLETNQNAIHVSDDRVWIGTSQALTVVDREFVLNRSRATPPAIAISDIRINLEKANWSGYEQEISTYGDWPAALEVPHNDDHFSFFFDALALSQPEGVKYQYMLEGIEEDWEGVTETDFATYSSLPFDDYTFKVRAIDQYGNPGETASFSFSISPPFWLSWWFIALEVLAISGIVYFIYHRRKQAFIEKMEKEKLEYKSKMLSLEQQTLNSSMNRHFIFNALNSIQYYINRQDRLAANKYLSSFAKLIRKNLDSSQVNFTSLREEIERLELYLGLEHMRFKDKFEFEIHVDDEVDQESIKVPSMLLQPFLENSIWHGILPKEECGYIEVDIYMKGTDEVAFVITDDGIGIDTSRAAKADRGDDHISQGMNITTGRIELLRKMTRKDVKLIGPYELKNKGKETSGTRVELILPVDFQDFYAN